jgi:diaminopimelate decarboxylase
MGSEPRTAGGGLAGSLIETGFGVEDGCLTIGGLSARDLARQFGTPLFVYDTGRMRASYRALQQALAGFARIFYSIKANPNPAVARVFVEEGAGLEIASGAEFLTARRAGCDAENILFAGPGKGLEELRLTLEAGIGEIHVESFEEIAHIAAIGARLGRTVPVAIRINPIASVQGGAMRMGGKPAAFGFDEEILDDVLNAIAARPELAIAGLHLFTGTQILDASVLLGQWQHALDLGRRVSSMLGRPLHTIDLGGGLGVPYHDGDVELDLAALGNGAKRLADQVKADPLLQGTSIVVEPGRYLTASAGVYLMAVRAVKMSRGARFVITDGGMHHHLAASGNLGQVIKRDYPIVAANRLDAPPLPPAALVGPLCTPLDTLGRKVSLPELAPGSLIAVFQSGAYGLTASPIGFLGHPMPAEVVIENAHPRLVRPRGTFEEPFTTPLPLPVPEPEAI